MYKDWYILVCSLAVSVLLLNIIRSLSVLILSKNEILTLLIFLVFDDFINFPFKNSVFYLNWF